MNAVIVIAIVVLGLALFLPLRWVLFIALGVLAFALRKKVIAGVRTIVGWFKNPPPPPKVPAEPPPRATPPNPEP